MSLFPKIRKKKKTFIPCGELPISRWAGKSFTAVEFANLRNTEPVKRHDGVVYNFNSKGYRCEEFENKKEDEFLVLSIGCSETFGITLHEKNNFLNIFCNKLSSYLNKKIIHYNISLPAKSNDYISSTVVNSLKMQPDLYLIVFTYLDRKEYIDVLGNSWDFLPRVDMSKIPSFMKDFWSRLSWLSNSYEDEINFYKNFTIINQILSNNKIPWFYSSIESIPFSQENYVGEFEKIDLAGDDIHRGPKSHEVLSSKFLDHFRNKYVIS